MVCYAEKRRFPAVLKLTAEFPRELGKELRRHREAAGLTRQQFGAMCGLHAQSLATYERGIRSITVERLVELCEVLKVDAAALLRLAVQRTRLDPEATDLHVDLHAVISSGDRGLRPLRRWARERIAQRDAANGNIVLPPTVVRELATAWGLSHSDLARTLVRFTPTP